MEIYVVTGWVGTQSYREYVTVYRDMKETAKRFIGNGKSVPKEQVGQLTEGKVNGSYQVVLVDQGEVPNARERVYTAVHAYERANWEVADAKMKRLAEHGLDGEVEYR